MIRASLPGTQDGWSFAVTGAGVAASYWVGRSVLGGSIVLTVGLVLLVVLVVGFLLRVRVLVSDATVVIREHGFLGRAVVVSLRELKGVEIGNVGSFPVLNMVLEEGVVRVGPWYGVGLVSTRQSLRELEVILSARLAEERRLC